MAPIRVIKSLRKTFKRATPNVGMPMAAAGPGPVMPNGLSTRMLQYECSPPGNQLDKALVGREIKFQGRIRRTSRFDDDHRSSISATTPGLPSSPPIPSDFRPPSPPRQSPVPERPAGPRQTARGTRFAEKHLDVPFSIYLACKSLNTPPYRGPVKSVERHGRETRRLRHVPLAWAKGSPFWGCKHRGSLMRSSDGFGRGGVVDRDDSTGRTGCDVEEVQSLLSLCTINTVPLAPSSEPLDEMEDVIPAPLIYCQPLSQLGQTTQSQALHTPPLANTSLGFNFGSPAAAVQLPSPALSFEKIHRVQPVEPGQVPPIVSQPRPRFKRDVLRQR